MYHKLANILSQEYNINIKAFDISLDELKPVMEDTEIIYYGTFPIENTSIQSYSYKEPHLKKWKSIVLNINPQRVIQVAETLNIFLEQHQLKQINLENLTSSINDFEDFQYELNNEGIVFLLFKYSLTQSFIDIAILS